MDPNGLFLLNNRIYILSASNLHIHMFSSTIMITFLPDILVKKNTGFSLPWIFLVQSPYWCTTILQVLYHLYVIQAIMSQALWISQITLYSWTTIEFHFYGLYRETSIILWVWHYLGHSWLAHQANNLYSYLWYHHIHRLSMSVHPLCVFQTWCSFSCYLQQRLRFCVKFLLIFRHCSQHAASLHFRLPSQRWWTNWMHK